MFAKRRIPLFLPPEEGRIALRKSRGLDFLKPKLFRVFRASFPCIPCRNPRAVVRRLSYVLRPLGLCFHLPNGSGDRVVAVVCRPSSVICHLGRCFPLTPLPHGSCPNLPARTRLSYLMSPTLLNPGLRAEPDQVGRPYPPAGSRRSWSTPT